MLFHCAPSNIACNSQAFLADPINAYAASVAALLCIAYYVCFKF